MTITSTRNRILDYCIIFMICVWFCSMAIDSFVLSSKHVSRVQNVGDATAKYKAPAKTNSTQPSVGGMSEIATDAGTVQKNTNTSTQKNNTSPKSWSDLAAANDPNYSKWEMFLDKRLNDPYYADAYKMLELDGETNEALREILVERSAAVNKAIKENTGTAGKLTLDTMLSIGSLAKSECDEKISTLIGQEKLALLSEYETTLTERKQIREFRAELEFSSEPLSVEQETLLLPILEGYVNNDPFLSTMNKIARIDPIQAITPLNFSEDALNMFKNVLTPEQIATLAALLRRNKNFKSINYSWGAMGEQMRKQDANAVTTK